MTPSGHRERAARDHHELEVAVLREVERATLSSFEHAATTASLLGRAAIPALMLLARDAPRAITQMCAVKALARSREPISAEALRRIASLPTEGRDTTVVAVSRMSREQLVREWTYVEVRDVVQSGSLPIGEAEPYDPMAPNLTILPDPEPDWDDVDPWSQAEFAEGYEKEMSDLTRQYGDPEWYEQSGRPRTSYVRGTRV